ncbi:water stress/hypersensitive response domain-containing protein [Pseudomonas alcaligenes]|uniref:Water stress/hypersensitive response domain-containing protein n=1 Tax=Aquipseudomonas alcaligenes TaxID=43263 RepID=A0ABR7RW49_AQUAC|nr:LEA type 2 family protein [Pseudomonas alcaligenes]MBC9249560.1 water stress/hypersensitive response domain-containing protein [Pseudomonas alcaligenes]
MSQLLRFLLLASLLLVLTACSSLFPRDPLHIDLVGLEPLPGQDLEMRFAVVLRVQNPNDDNLDYNGVALDLAINGQPLASGVSAEAGQVPRFGEALVRIPMSVSTFSLVRQAWAASGYRQGQNLPYRLHGKLANGLFGTVRFNASGTLNWPTPASTP